jgi:hypothetical protein
MGTSPRFRPKQVFIKQYKLITLVDFFKVTRRIGLITGLDMSVAESLQVVNYGIGGQYEPHNDHSSVCSFCYSSKIVNNYSLLLA